VVSVDDDRLDELVAVIARLASGELTARLEPSPARDAVDAVITGIDLLADELNVMQRTLEQQVTERTEQLDRARRAMARLALTDPLTGLANRALLADRIGQATARAERGARPPCLVLLDLDGFKTINDGLGHDAGDRVLVEVARRLTGVVRAADTVARLGGDEFAILLPDVTDDEAERVAQRALRALRPPVTVAGWAVVTSASIGVCLGRRGQSAELLLRDADTAMYAAKAGGRGAVRVFHGRMHDAARQRLQLASELADAAALGQLRLYYQPVVHLATGRIVAVEAVLRWLHPKRGVLEPAAFLRAAEDSGQLAELGRWILRSAVAQLQAWQERLPAGFRVHLNLSATQVRWPGLTRFLSDTLREHAVPPDRLAVGISEAAVLTDEARGVQTLADLRRLGVGVHLDDFGTGFSSISYLRTLPIDTVTIDPSLITGIATDPRQAAFVAALLRLIHTVGLRAVARGVHTPAHRAHLHTLGCCYGQGHLFGEPHPADHTTTLLLAGQPATSRP
jgi:diguanylate cyclase (GGDEF)-like protein